MSTTMQKKSTPKVMRLVDPSTGEMRCKVCGAVHWACLASGGHYRRGSWQCNYDCRLPEHDDAPDAT